VNIYESHGLTETERQYKPNKA